MRSRRELRLGLHDRLNLLSNTARAAHKGSEETRQGGTNNHEDEQSHSEGRDTQGVGTLLVVDHERGGHFSALVDVVGVSRVLLVEDTPGGSLQPPRRSATPSTIAPPTPCRGASCPPLPSPQPSPNDPATPSHPPCRLAGVAPEPRPHPALLGRERETVNTAKGATPASPAPAQGVEGLDAAASNQARSPLTSPTPPPQPGGRAARPSRRTAAA